MIITAGKFKGRKVTAPDENITRPTLSKVRMSVFNTLQSLIEFQGSSFLDMYAGSGIMGLEALSRGFTKVTAIEKNPKAVNIIKSNIKTIIPSPLEGADCERRLEHFCKEPKTLRQSAELPFNTSNQAEDARRAGEVLKLLFGDSLKLAPKLEKFDVVYIDPPYFAGIYEASLNAIKNIADGIVILEHVTDVDFQRFEIIKQKKYGDKFITFLSK